MEKGVFLKVGLEIQVGPLPAKREIGRGDAMKEYPMLLFICYVYNKLT